MTHADAQKVVKESENSLELQLERNIAAPETNGIHNNHNGQTFQDNGIVSQLNVLDEYMSQLDVGSWSSESTSTGSTTIHVPSINSDDPASSELVWSPSRKRANLHLNCNVTPTKEIVPESSQTTQQTTTVKETHIHLIQQDKEEESSPVWQPFGAPCDARFRPVKLDINTTTKMTTTSQKSDLSKTNEPEALEAKTESPKLTKKSKKKAEKESSKSNEPNTEGHKSPDLASAPTTFTKSGWSSHLPPSQSPTITLLQKAREGQIPKGAIYIEDKPDSTPIPKNAVLIDQKVIVEGDKVHTDSYYAVPTVTTESTTHTVNAPPKYDGIGPTEYGIPVGLRTGVKEEYASDWYKSMYKSLHRVKFPPNESNKTVHVGGYMSEPEFDRNEKLRSKYASTEYRRKPEKTILKVVERPTSPVTSVSPKTVPSETTNVIRHEPKREAYRVEPRSIAEYEPGKSSLAEKEFHKHEYIGNCPKSPQGLGRRWPNVDGYESDSTLIRKTGRNIEVDPEQQKSWYKEIQKGGEIPLTGLRKSAPEKPSASPHQYQETEVNIHFRSPIRSLEKDYIEEEELRRKQEDAMRKLYDEEKRKRQLQELAEMEMRRHSDNFTPSQKSPIPLNRYDNPFDTVYTQYYISGNYRGPPPKTMARALYPFTAQTTKELSLNKGDIVYINKQIDRNWFEGEHHGLIGIFPVTYVEIIPNEKANLQPRKAAEGEAIVKYNFRAQSPMELSLFKGEKVILTRRTDRNWYEGRIGNKKGIFPVLYVDVLKEPGEFIGNRAISPKPPASPVFGPIINGSPPKSIEGPTFNTGLRPNQEKPPLKLEKLQEKTSLTQTLHIDTYNEPIPYRSLYTYKPQNDDELELKEGDTVYVMEKCDDGWYVGTSLRTGMFGTFPGNYVERI